MHHFMVNSVRSALNGIHYKIGIGDVQVCLVQYDMWTNDDSM